MTNLWHRPHALYRFYDTDGVLLYIGITADLGSRLTQHSDDKPWWCDVTQVHVEHHPSREAVLAAEQQAISAEQPLHNITHNRRRTKGSRPAAQTYIAPPMLQPGQVVALALNGERCPIGLVVDSDHEGAQLHLYSWLTNSFTVGGLWVSYRDIRMLRCAEQTPSDVAGERLFDMAPLAEFQNDWTTNPLTDSDEKQIRERLKRPGYVGPFLDPEQPVGHCPTPATVPAVPDQCPTKNHYGHCQKDGLTCDNTQTVPAVPEIPDVLLLIKDRACAQGDKTSKPSGTGTAGTATPMPPTRDEPSTITASHHSGQP